MANKPRTTRVTRENYQIFALYMTEARRYPLLNKEEEYDLAIRVRQNGDPRASTKLAQSHLGLIVKIAIEFLDYGMPLEELVAEGKIGMVKAIKKFDPDRGFRLNTYARSWVRGEIQEYIFKNWSSEKMSMSNERKKLFFKLRSLKAQKKITEEGDLSPEEVAIVARELVVRPANIIAMNRRLQNPDFAHTVPLPLTDPADDRPNPEEIFAEKEYDNVRRGWLEAGLEALDERERRLVSERWLREKPTSPTELGKQYQVSAEAIRLAQNKAYGKLKTAVLAMAFMAIIL